MFFNNIFRPIQFKFKDRVAAAIALSNILKSSIKKNDRKDTLVLAIPRAGILTADIVTKKLSIPNFDIVYTKKLTDPNNKEQAIGAIIDDGFTFLKHDLIKDFQISEDYLEKEISFQIQQINQRKKKYLQNLDRSFLATKIKEHKIILLVDDGIATGATMMVTAKWIQQLYKDSTTDQKSVVIATPVAPKNITEQIKNECKMKVVTVFNPLQDNFHSVEQYHQNFEEITDEQVINIINEKTKK